MSGSELRSSDELRRDLNEAIALLTAASNANPAALVEDADRLLIDRSILGVLSLVVEDPTVAALSDRFEPKSNRRQALARDVLITLRLMSDTLNQHVDTV